MENQENSTDSELFEEGPEYDDSLSFCNFSMQDNKDSSVMQSPRNSTAEEFFEFFSTEMSPSAYSAPDIIFCGKIIHEDQEELNEYQKRDYLAMVRSKSFRRPPSFDQYPFLNEEKDAPVNKVRSSALQFLSSPSAKHSTYQIQKVNITSLTSMSSKSRRRMFMFGPVKFKPEMELSAIKERQGRRVPTMMFPAPVDSEKTVVSSGGGKPRGKSSHWGMLRLLRGRSHLTTALAKSLGCITPMVGAGKWIRVAN